MTKCHWVFPWVYWGCKNEALITGMCEEHTTHCINCDNLATGGCCHTSQFVCGYPLCHECTHSEKGSGHEKKVVTNEG